MPQPVFHTYILTNAGKSVLYTGVTNNLPRRLIEHWIGRKDSFTTSYKTCYLIWYESSKYILNAIAREKEIKDMSRAKKEQLIMEFNPDWTFLNKDILGNWPPSDNDIDAVRRHLEENPLQRGR